MNAHGNQLSAPYAHEARPEHLAENEADKAAYIVTNKKKVRECPNVQSRERLTGLESVLLLIRRSMFKARRVL